MEWKNGNELDEIKKKELKKDITKIMIRNSCFSFLLSAPLLYYGFELLIYQNEYYELLGAFFFLIIGICSLSNGLKRIKFINNNKFYYKEDIIVRRELGGRVSHSKVIGMNNDAYYTNRFLITYRKDEKFIGVKFIDYSSTLWERIVINDPTIYKVKW